MMPSMTMAGMGKARIQTVLRNSRRRAENVLLLPVIDWLCSVL